MDGIVVISTKASTANGGPAYEWDRRSYDLITALRASDGSVLWQHPDPLYGGVDNLGDDRGMLLLSNTNHLIAMHHSDGAVLWQIARGSWGRLPPVFEGDVIYASDSQGLYATRLSDGQLLWQLPPLAATPSSGTAGTVAYAYLRPIVSGDVVYAGSLDTLVAVRATDGAILWQTSIAPAVATPTPNPTGRNHVYTPGPSPIPLQPVAVVGGQLYVSADDEGLLLVRTLDGDVDGQIPTQAQTHTVVPVLIDGTLYFGVADVAPNQITFSLQSSDQKLLWRVPRGAAGDAIIAAEDGVIYLELIYLESRSLLAIRISDGTVLWYAPLPEGRSASDGGHLYFSQSTGYISICASSRAPLGAVTQLSKKDGSISWVTGIPAAR
jgi:outer membrane protein assembly factor BamB